MNPYSFALLFFAFGSLFIGLLIWFKRADSIGLVYFIFSMLTLFWAIGFSIMFNENISHKTALFSARFADAFALFIPSTWLNLVLLMTDDLKRQRRLLVFLYSISFIILPFAFTPLFISGIKPIMGFEYWLEPGPIFHVFTFIFFLFVPYGFLLLIKKVKNSSLEEKTQLKGFIIATMVGFIGGGITFLPNYDIQVPQYNIFFTPVYPFVTAYFLIKHRLFDLEAVIHLFQREKLATLGLLTASVNHEIRNPLYAAREQLNTYIENLKQGIPTKDPLKTSEKVKSQIDRALDVITKLNRFSKPIDQTVASNSQASVSEALQTVLDLVSYEFKLDKIKIQNEISHSLPPIQTDQRQLEESLFNLIVNACHAMDQGGTLTISASHPERSEGSRDSSPFGLRMTGKVRITISDTGTGISQDQMKHLFEPFHTTKGEKGTGLGLYITKQLVERNGGKILVKSKEGNGTSFILEFKTG